MAKDGAGSWCWGVKGGRQNATTVRILGDRVCLNGVQLGRHLTRHLARRERILFSEDVDSRTSCKSVGTHAPTGSRSLSFSSLLPHHPVLHPSPTQSFDFHPLLSFFLQTFYSLSTFWHPLTGPQLPLPGRLHPFAKCAHQSRTSGRETERAIGEETWTTKRVQSRVEIRKRRREMKGFGKVEEEKPGWHVSNITLFAHILTN